MLSDAQGAFQASDLEPGPLTLRAQAKGFDAAEVHTDVRAGQTLELEVELHSPPAQPVAPAKLHGTVLSPEGNALAAEVRAGSVAPVATLKGDYNVEVPPGEVDLVVRAKGYLEQHRKVVAAAGETVVTDVILRPSTKLVVLRKDKIEIKKQVHFAMNRDIILPDSEQLLDEIAVTIQDNADAIPHLRVEGHTDSAGEDAYNLELSRHRAESVVRALVERGVPKERLEARGFGRTRPIAPNVTEAGRARNRRVEFIIEKAPEKAN